MKRLFSFLFLIVFFWQLAGFFVYFEIERYHVRKDIKLAIKQSLPQNEFKQFNFTEIEFQHLTWINDHEFKMNGRMYDVVKKYKNDAGYSISCIDDIQETRLFAQLDEATSSNLNNQPEKAPLKSFVKLLKLVYRVPDSVFWNYEEVEFQNQKNQFHYQSNSSEFNKL
ncbi:MAG: hypothetical protein FJZ67_11910, partial [Bacteroidetes bacterium]|nr:hypothetical protein [Bacteroidota bacterium]